MPNNSYNTIKLKKYAINYLSKYSSSKSNLVKILKNKIQKLQIEKKDKFILYNSIDEIIYDLEKNNFINDVNYSSSKIRLFTNQGKSRLFIKSYLFKKGVEKDIISNCLKEIDFNNDNWEVESARVFVRKKGIIHNINNKEKNLSKMARAGFNYDICKKILDEI